jgi:hypothetical protein
VFRPTRLDIDLLDSLFTNIPETARAASARLRVAAVNVPRDSGLAHVLHEFQEPLAPLRGVLDPRSAVGVLNNAV